jgi:formylglycine-generating enzyme
MHKLLFTIIQVCRRQLTRYTLLFAVALAWVSPCRAADPLTLQIQVQGQDLVLSGPNWATNAVLEWSSDLSGGIWTNLQVTFDPVHGTILSDYANSPRFFRLHILQQGPTLTRQPSGANRSVGESVTFSVEATGSDPMSYQWFFNETNVVEGATNSDITLSGLQLTNAGSYRVQVTNLYGSVLSDPATLTVTESTSPPGMALIAAGPFSMGDTFAEALEDERPVHTVDVSAFYMDTNLVSKALWDEVVTWAGTNGYSFENAGYGKGTNYPVETINWFDAVKWCNARSEMEGLTPVYYTNAAQTDVYKTGQVNLAQDFVLWTGDGYRLPTEAEWEKAARGGVSGQRFPWGDTITHSNANYLSSTNDAYDVSETRGTHPLYSVGAEPYTSPVGSFTANGYGLFDMAGNVFQWCWDWADYHWYENENAVLTDTCGPTNGVARVIRGGGWSYKADRLCCARRGNVAPAAAEVWASFGFRCVRGISLPR